MKIKIILLQSIPIFLIFCSVFFLSCGDDTTSSNSSNGKPDIQFKPGAVYMFRNDSISQNGNYNSTDWTTKDSVMPTVNYYGKDCFPVNSVTKSGIGVIIRQSTDYYSYTQQEGIFYQWGARNIIDPNQAPSWDKIADFTQTIGTEVSLYTLSTLFNTPNLSANVFSKVVVDTSTPLVSQAKCYRVTVRAAVYYSTISLGNVYIDYYIGYASSTANPSGRLGTHIYPVNIGVPGVYSLQSDGADQRLTSFKLP